MDQKPLVSIICLCYNHELFVKEAIESVWNQSYDNIELIVVDDCSTDGSKHLIDSLISDKDIPFISLEKNIGNTSAFNRGCEISKGQYIIDLSADDVLDESRVKKQISYFQSCKESIGVIYSDAIYISEEGKRLSSHFDKKKLIPFNGDIYSEVIEKYFIPAPTMMIKRIVLEQMKGYDESLAYEDFDFWIRSSRYWHYGFQPEALTYIRRVKGSLSSMAYHPHNRQLYSTYLICKKIYELNKSEEENEALIRRLKYEMRHAFFSNNHTETQLFFELLRQVKGSTFIYGLLNRLSETNINLSFVRNLYCKIRYSI